MPKYIEINQHRIGPGEPVYIIAEMSANHHQDFQKAVDILHAARDAGADAVKLQTYTADTLTLKSDNPCFRIGKGTLWEGRTLHDLYREAFTPWEWQPKLKAIADDMGMALFSSPFDASAVAFLESMHVPAYKVASFEIVDLPLLRCIARTGKPVILSTGMASLGEIDEAVRTIRESGNNAITILKCTSAYPAPYEEMHLRTIPHLSDCFNVPAGLSDHSIGSAVPVAAVALGACVIEKHLTLSRSAPGPDSAFSMEPAEFKAMVDAIRIAEKALGTIQYQTSRRQEASRKFRRSLFVSADVRAGEYLTPDNIRSVRPSDGLHTRYYEIVLGKKACQDISAGTPLAWEHIAGEEKNEE